MWLAWKGLKGFFMVVYYILENGGVVCVLVWTVFTSFYLGVMFLSFKDRVYQFELEEVRTKEICVEILIRLLMSVVVLFLSYEVFKLIIPMLIRDEDLNKWAEVL